MKKFEVWNRGFSKQFNCPWSTLICTIKGESFPIAFREYLKEKEWSSWLYNEKEQTFLGDKLSIKEL